jgi:hypothetical protein
MYEGGFNALHLSLLPYTTTSTLKNVETRAETIPCRSASSASYVTVGDRPTAARGGYGGMSDNHSIPVGHCTGTPSARRRSIPAAINLEPDASAASLWLFLCTSCGMNRNPEHDTVFFFVMAAFL